MKHMITLRVQCPFCNLSREVSVPKAGYVRWQKGASIQDAMPAVSDSDREALMTGICDACFPDEVEDDYDDEPWPDDDDFDLTEYPDDSVYDATDDCYLYDRHNPLSPWAF